MKTYTADEVGAIVAAALAAVGGNATTPASGERVNLGVDVAAVRSDGEQFNIGPHDAATIAAEMLPGGRVLKSRDTIKNWMVYGRLNHNGRRVRLEHVEEFGKRFTSREAIRRFISATYDI